jgi:SAM-dependent methyltransferase
LDLACGHGHAAVWLAQQGWDVTAIDISPVAVGGARELAKAHHVSVRWLIADLDDAPLEEGAYDLIAVFRFLDRKALPSRIVRALRPGGWLVYETFLATGNGPSTQHTRNPEFLLESGELPRLFFGLQTSVYEEHSSPCGAVGRLVARKL